ncbi:MAG: riboflavin synthase [Gammaproteobacteria bacterium]|nr:riboflavin synthase [Gammaproteobacteria bacterium]
MFTGIVQSLGTLKKRETRGAGARFCIAAGTLGTGALEPGASVAVNGCCLTVVEPDAEGFCADASAETLAKTTLNELEPGALLNLEPALKAGDALGGHLVSGHVDGVGEVVAMREEGEAQHFTFCTPEGFARFIAPKGSIAVDGVSLTVNEVGGNEFEVMIIPATLERTIIASYVTGTRINLEVDQIARYLDRLLAARRPP